MHTTKLLSGTALALLMAATACADSAATRTPSAPPPAAPDPPDEDTAKTPPPKEDPAPICADAKDCEARAETAKDADKPALYRRGCDLGSARSCFHLAELEKKNPDTALPLYLKACTTGDDALAKAACTGALSISYPNKNYADSAVAAQRACEVDDAQACNVLGVQYAKGQGVKPDIDKARALIAKACKAGHAQACENEKHLSGDGDGDGKDDDRLDVPNANVKVSSLSADGMKLTDLQCHLPGAGFGALMAGPLIASSLAKKKRQLAACGSKVRVRWVSAGGKVSKVEAKAKNAKAEACVKRVLQGTKMANNGTCAVTLP